MGSLPVRERGLKCLAPENHRLVHLVAPRSGAWIEIPYPNTFSMCSIVAPRSGAWIEMQQAQLRQR